MKYKLSDRNSKNHCVSLVWRARAFYYLLSRGDNCKPQVFARQDQAMLKLSLNHLRRNRKRFNGFFNVVGLIFHESGAVKNDNVHKNLRKIAFVV